MYMESENWTNISFMSADAKFADTAFTSYSLA